jgi:hypothetical protein
MYNIVLGSDGYIGSTLIQQLSIEGGVKGYDNNILSNKIGNTIIYDVLYDGIINDDIKDVNKIIWCIDIDREEFYETKIGIKYSEQNLKVFKEYYDKFQDKLILISGFSKFKDSNYDKFLESKREIMCYSNILNVYECYGPSNKFRSDLLLNSMFLSAYFDGVIVVDKWVKSYPVAGVGNVGECLIKFIGDSYFKEYFDIQKIVSYDCSTLDYAYIIKSLFDKEIQIIANNLEFDDIYNKYNYIDNSPYDDYEFNIKNSFNTALKQLSLDEVGCVKDIYSNESKLVNFSDESIDFINKMTGKKMENNNEKV